MHERCEFLIKVDTQEIDKMYVLHFILDYILTLLLFMLYLVFFII